MWIFVVYPFWVSCICEYCLYTHGFHTTSLLHWSISSVCNFIYLLPWYIVDECSGNFVSSLQWIGVYPCPNFVHDVQLHLYTHYSLYTARLMIVHLLLACMFVFFISECFLCLSASCALLKSFFVYLNECFFLSLCICINVYVFVKVFVLKCIFWICVISTLTCTCLNLCIY